MSNVYKKVIQIALVLSSVVTGEVFVGSSAEGGDLKEAEPTEAEMAAIETSVDVIEAFGYRGFWRKVGHYLERTKYLDPFWFFYNRDVDQNDKSSPKFQERYGDGYTGFVTELENFARISPHVHEGTSTLLRSIREALEDLTHNAEINRPDLIARLIRIKPVLNVRDYGDRPSNFTISRTFSRMIKTHHQDINRYLMMARWAKNDELRKFSGGKTPTIETIRAADSEKLENFSKSYQKYSAPQPSTPVGSFGLALRGYMDTSCTSCGETRAQQIAERGLLVTMMTPIVSALIPLYNVLYIKAAIDAWQSRKTIKATSGVQVQVEDGYLTFEPLPEKLGSVSVLTVNKKFGAIAYEIFKALDQAGQKVSIEFPYQEILQGTNGRFPIPYNIKWIPRKFVQLGLPGSWRRKISLSTLVYAVQRREAFRTIFHNLAPSLVAAPDRTKIARSVIKRNCGNILQELEQ